jgi:ATP/maltotriose-dependent transcriptional regulator MalT
MADVDIPVDRARAAIGRRDWHGAYEAYSSANPSLLTASDLEGLADAAWWVSRFPESIEARHRAYEAYVAAGDQRSAAGVAARLAIEHFVREEPSIGGGYLMRAQRHAQAVPEGPEHGFLAMVEANVARFSGDLEGAIARSGDAVAIGQRYGVPDLIAMAIHTQGLSLLDAGRIADGLALMDEAMVDVLSGTLDPYFTGIIYCSLIAACLELSDIRRAGEWSDAAGTWCDSLQPDSPFPAMCRVNRAEVARLRGAWAEAEAEAERASKELEAIEPGLAGLALVQVGEIHRRTGDLAGAAAAFARARELGANPQPGLSLLHLMQGRAAEAVTSLDLALAAEHQPARRARLLAAKVDAACAAGTIEAATVAAAELDSLARTGLAPTMEALAATAAGAVALASGDAEGALERCNSAAVAWQRLRLPSEVAKARAMVGRALAAIGDEEGARAEYRAALHAFEELGAVPEAAAIRALLTKPGGLPDGLTGREAEVLRLVAAGKTNRDIAVELVISEHTVARHLQNLFAKIDVSSRAAATAYAYEHDLM